MNFSGNIIIVTGASSDLGKVLCNMLHNLGATVIGIYNSNKINEEYETYKCDISNEEEVNNLINNIINIHEKIDCLINCAASSSDADLYDKDSKSFLNTLNVNVVGTFLMIKYASKHMNNGVIINVSSTDGIDTYNPISLDYCASKAAINNMTQNLALRINNAKVCAIAPNWIDTKSTLSMDPKYLEEELKRINQSKLLKKEDVAVKIIEMIINNDDYVTGDIVRMDKHD